MPLTSKDIANESLQLIGGNQPLVVAGAPNFDNSPAGTALKLLYTPTYRAVLRQFGWDFARATFTLVPTGNPAPFPWTYEYGYPPGGVQIGAMFSAADDPNNPIPYNFNVGNAVVSSVQQRVIWTNLQNALVRLTNQPTESTMDDDFHQAFVGLLANVVATAIAGKPDLAMAMLQRGSAFEQIGEGRQD